MDPWRKFSFQASGPKFYPGQTGLEFSQSFEPGGVATFGGHRGLVVQFGAALYTVPAELECEPRQSHFAAVLAHLSKVRASLRAAGAVEFVLHMHRTVREACNEEFTQEELQLLASLGCHLFYVARNE
jgi:hypothetical protein